MTGPRRVTPALGTQLSPAPQVTGELAVLALQAGSELGAKGADCRVLWRGMQLKLPA